MPTDTTASSSTTDSAARPTPGPGPRGWQLAGFSGLKAYATPLMAAMIVLGFASGLPLYMVFQKLSFWLRLEGIERSTIGFFYWVTFAYSFKVIWAPLVDRMPLPFLTAKLGRRRSWMVLAITGTIAGLLIIATSSPANGLALIAGGSLLLAFSGATLDIAIDAWRIESAPTDRQANMAAAYSLGYRFAYIFAGIGLAIADFSSWNFSFAVMALAMAICGALVLLMKEPEVPERAIRTAQKTMAGRLTASVVEPFVQVAQRLHIWFVPVILLVAIYRLSDFTMGVMASPLYADLGFAPAAVGALQSGPGVVATLIGLFLGGLAAMRFGVMWALVLGGLIAFLTNGAYAWLAATAGPDDLWRLTIALLGDNVAGGYATTVFIAYMSGLTDPKYAATQYALFGFFYSFVAKFTSGFSGVLADSVGYPAFFLITATYALPAAALTFVIIRYGTPAARGIQEPKTEPAAA